YPTSAGLFDPALSYLYVNGTTASLPFTMPRTPGTYEFRFLQNCANAQKLATSPTVTVQNTVTPSLTLNGSSVPITVAAGSIVTLGVQNGPGTSEDCVGLYPTSAGLFDPAITLFYIGGTTTTVPFTMPGTSGPYEFRFLQHCANAQKLARSPTVTVQSTGGPSLTVNGSSSAISVP